MDNYTEICVCVYAHTSQTNAKCLRDPVFYKDNSQIIKDDMIN